jgi:2-iminobutanoate/2-iminopropanoate deaminase
MTTRRSIYLDTVHHRNPIPVACRLDDLIVTGVLNGCHSDSGEFPDTLDAQCALLFQLVRTVVERAGASTDDIVKMTFWLQDRGDKAALNREWERMFPDPENRPARHTPPAGNLEPPRLIQADFVALVRRDRQS